MGDECEESYVFHIHPPLCINLLNLVTMRNVLGFSCAKDMNVHDDEWGVKKTLTVVIMSVQVFGFTSSCENNYEE